MTRRTARFSALAAIFFLAAPALSLGQLQPTPTPEAAAKAATEPLEPFSGAFLSDQLQNRQLLVRVLQAEVQDQLKRAQEAMSSGDPDGARQELKILLEQVESTPELDPELRKHLRNRVVSAIRQSQRRAVEQTEKLAFAAERKAAGMEVAELVRRQGSRAQKVKQLLARFNSLMDEGRYLEAEDEVAEEVRKLTPEAVTPAAAAWAARFVRNTDGLQRVRMLRFRNFADTLFQNEAAATPFVDEPPINYPTAEVWEDLTRRRAKYKSMNLAGDDDREKLIYQSLDDDTVLEFIETPLSEVIEFLKDLHQIPIVIDSRALNDAGIATDTPVNRNLRGVSLRSALRLMLKELELTYVIRDEVLQITTPEEAEAQLVTRVYPVGDLVLPITTGQSPLGFGGGMMGGMGGGIGGGMNGIGRGLGAGRPGGRNPGGAGPFADAIF